MKINLYKKQRTKGLHDEVDSLRNTYIPTYINQKTPVSRPCDNIFYNGTSVSHMEWL